MANFIPDGDSDVDILEEDDDDFQMESDEGDSDVEILSATDDEKEEEAESDADLEYESGPRKRKATGRADNLKRARTDSDSLQETDSDSLQELPPSPASDASSDSGIVQFDHPPLLPINARFRLPADHASIEDAFNPYEYDEFADILDTLYEHWGNIRTHTTLGRRVDTHTIRLIGQAPEAPTLYDRLNEIFAATPSSFDINFQQAFILENTETGEIKYYHAGNNTRILGSAVVIRGQKDFEKMLEKLRQFDAAKKAVHRRPNSKWVLRALTNIEVIITHRKTSYATGQVRLPKWLAKNHGVENFQFREGHLRVRDDKLCFFKCLARHYFPNGTARRIDAAATLYMDWYCRHLRHTDPKDFRGILLSEIPALEYFFDQPITVLQLMPYVNEWPEKKKKRRRKKSRRPPQRQRSRRNTGARAFLDDEAICDDVFEEDDEDEEEEEVDEEEEEQLNPVQLAEALAKRLAKEKEAIKKRRFSAFLLHRGTTSIEARKRLGAGDRFPDAIDYRERFQQIEGRTPLFLNLFQGEEEQAHFSYIQNLDKYSRQFHCPKCSRIFHRIYDLHRHEPSCKGGRTEDLYPGNGFYPRQTVLEKLQAKYDIKVPDDCQIHPYYATHDWECLAEALPGTVLLTRIPDIDFELPAEMDLSNPPPDLPAAVRRQFSHLHTHYSPSWDSAAIFRPKLADIPNILRKLAAKQTRRFDMLVKVVKYRPGRKEISRTTLASVGGISSPREFENFLATITKEKIRECTHQGQWIALEVKLSVRRVEYTSQCIPASVSIATNVPLKSMQNEDGTPRPKFILAADTTEEGINDLVFRFRKVLYTIAEAARIMMHNRLQPVFEQVEELLFNKYLFRMHQIIYEAVLGEANKARSEANEISEPWADPDKAKDYFERMAESADGERLAKKLDSELLRVGLDVSKLDLPDKKYKQYDVLLSAEQRREYFECKRNARDLQYLHKQLMQHCQLLSTFGFNSGKFDINLAKKYLLSELQKRQDEAIGWNVPEGTAEWYANHLQSVRPIHIIKRNQNYMSITSSRIRFLDMSNFVAPGTSYEGFLKSQNVSSNKFFWPHDYFTSLNVLDETQVPPIEAFYNSLRDEHMSEADYKVVCDTWKEKEWRNLGDMLKYYNNQDVLPFLEGIAKYRQYYADPVNGKIDFIAGGNVSTPGLAEQEAYRSVDPYISFVLPQRTTCVDNSWLHQLCKNNTVGGPSTVFRRYACRNKTRIRSGNNNSRDHLPCKHLMSLDANALYLWASSQMLPIQIPRRWIEHPDGTFGARPLYRFAQSQTEWLAWEHFCTGSKIWHRFSGGIEHYGSPHKFKPKGQRTQPDKVPRRDIRVEGISVDGWDPLTKTCYFFDGCFWHNHEFCGFHSDKRKKPTPEQAEVIKANQRKDIKFRDELRSKGYNVVRIWECEWSKMKLRRRKPYPEGVSSENLSDRDPTALVYMQKRDREHEMLKHHNEGAMRLNQFRDKYFIFPRLKKTKGLQLTQDELIKAIKDGLFFGIVQCDIHVPDHLKEHFAELQPIFKNIDVTREDIGRHMREHCEKHREWGEKKRMLVGSYFGKEIALISPLLQWYLQHGLKITKIYTAVEWKGYRCFKKFADSVTEGRRASDRDPALKPWGELKKLTGNSIYGKSIMDLMQHLQVLILGGKQLEESETNPFRKNVAELYDDFYEVEMRKKKITWTTYFPFGFFVYGYAKLRMLQFHYDFLGRFLDPRKFELLLMDTDSEFLALAEETIDECVRSRYKGSEEYETARIEFLGHRDGPLAEYDKRVPGKFKVEWEGDEIVALNSKTYFGIGARGDKWASKGVQKRLNRLKLEHYKRVLETRETYFGPCRSFKAKEGGMYRFDGERAGLTYIYGKRPVADDGIMTTAFLR